VPDDFPEIWSHIEESVFSQGWIYPAAEPTIRVLLAALLDVRSEISVLYGLDLLFLIGQSALAGATDLSHRCVAELHSGVWLMVKTALFGTESVRNACLEVLDLCSPENASFIRS
jgi:hypothetical protein